MRRWLYIDTRTRPETVFGWLDEQGGLKLWPLADAGRGLLSSLSRRIRPEALAQAQGIFVVRGPGSFSSIRTGVLVANLLSRIFGLPLCGLMAEEAGDGPAIIQSLAHRRPLPYAEPLYDSEPNITLAKPKPCPTL